VTSLNRVKRSRLVDNDDGQALIEFALSAVLYFVLLFGVIEFSRAIFYYNVLATVSRDGARYAVVRGSESGRAVDEAAVRTFVQSQAFGLAPTVDVTWTPDNRPGSTVLVRVDYTFSSIVPLLPVQTLPMSATCRMTILR
jgi:Flp pilus assembly protein TadG